MNSENCSTQKKSITFFILFILVSFVNILHAQNISCGTDQILMNNPELKKMLDNLEKEYQKKKSNQINLIPDMTTVYTIPVVFHIYHLGESIGTGSNVSDANIQDALASMNQAFRASGSYAGISPDVKIQFVLASRSPTCQNTNGIVRIDARDITNYQTNGLAYNDEAMVNALRALSSWPISSYINIRVVHNITGAGGFAYFLNDLFMPAFATNGGYSSFWAHEMGHSMNLYHTFQGDNGNQVCPPNADPENDGDKISDTDPHKQGDGCNYTASNPCTGNPFGDVLKNIMSYSCSDRFTIKQVERMRYALINYRNSLINSLGKTPLPPSFIPPATACNVSASNGLSIYYGIDSFTLGSISYNSASSSSNGTNYHDNTCLSLGTFTQGNTYNFTLTPTFGNYMCGKIFIDYNNDGDFDDLSETAFTGCNVQFSGNITIPNSALTNTNLRMRVMLDGSLPTSCNLPGSSGYGSGSAVDFTLNISSCTLPAAPTVSSTTINSGQTATLTATGCSGTVTWYANATGGTGLSTGASFTTPPLTTTTTYYASCMVSSCESVTRGSGTVTVNSACTPPAAPNFPFQPTLGFAGTLTLNYSTMCSGGTLKWYDAQTGGNLLYTGGTYTTPVLYSATNYFVSCTINDCESTRGQLTINYTPLPCVSSKNLTGNYGDASLQTNGTITSTSTILTGARTKFFAGQSITLTHGFNTSASSVFRAEIQNCVSNSGLIAYYPFNGNANDESGNLKHATNNGALLTTDRFGYFQKAYYFDGVSDWINTPLVQSNLTEYTISAWVQPNFTNNQEYVIIQNRGASPGSGKGFTLHYQNSSSRWGFALDGDATYIGKQAPYPNNTNWVHVVATWSAGSATSFSPSQFNLYINGILQSSAVSQNIGTATVPSIPAGTAAIGRSEAWNSYFKGKIDDIRIYNRALNATEVKSIYNFER
jgi:hypothetical protein